MRIHKLLPSKKFRPIANSSKIMNIFGARGEEYFIELQGLGIHSLRSTQHAFIRVADCRPHSKPLAAILRQVGQP